MMDDVFTHADAGLLRKRVWNRQANRTNRITATELLRATIPDKHNPKKYCSRWALKVAMTGGHGWQSGPLGSDGVYPGQKDPCLGSIVFGHRKTCLCLKMFKSKFVHSVQQMCVVVRLPRWEIKKKTIFRQKSVRTPNLAEFKLFLLPKEATRLGLNLFAVQTYFKIAPKCTNIEHLRTWSESQD